MLSMAIKEIMNYSENSHRFKIRLGTHFFTISNLNDRLTGIVLKFCTRFITYGYVRTNNKMERKASKVFAGRTRSGSEYRFHIGQYPAFVKLLEYNFIFSDSYDVEDLPTYKPSTINVKLNPKFELRDYQTECIDFLVRNDFDDNHSRLVSLATGLGKSLIAAAAVSKIGLRTAIVILPQYMEKWASDLTNNLLIKPKDIMLVQGSDQLKGIISLGLENKLDIKFIIISLTTYQNFIKSYDEDKDVTIDIYGCSPEDFFKVLKVGILTIDETHQHIHGVYKLLSHTNGPKVIGLSGTLISDDPTIDNIHKIIFPKEIRFDKIKMEKYIKVRAVSYFFNNIAQARIRTTSYGTNAYSHVEFEKSLLKNKEAKRNYFKLIDSLVVDGYISEYMKGDRLVIFAATIKMCDELLQYFKTKYSHRFDIRRYVEDDPYANAIDSDIRITTIQSCGTAMDIPNLRAAVMTVSIQSPVANLQSLGRLRKLKDRDVKFYYCYCGNIPKQVDYHKKRMELFSDRVASIKEFNSDIAL